MFDGPGKPECEWCGGTGMLEGYGAFPGGDPRNFTPDQECSTEKERADHKAACESFSIAMAPAHVMRPVDGGFVHTARVMFGLGSYRIPCFECSQASGGHP